MLKLSEFHVVVVEDEIGSRHLLKNLFRHAGIRHVDCYCNGAELLKHHSVVDCALLILGYDLGDKLRGPDLLRHLIRQQRITAWTQVVFITNQVDAVKAELTHRLLPTRVISKPISFKLLQTQIRENLLLQEHAKPLLQELMQSPCMHKLRQLLRLQAGRMPKASRDTIRQVQTHILLDWGYAQEAWQLAGRIKSENIALELKLELSHLLGKTQTVQQLLQLMTEKQILPRHQGLYRWRMAADAEQIGIAPAAVNFSVKDSDLTPQEMGLTASLLFQHQGYLAALEYLQDKIKRSKNDYYQTNVLLITAIALVFLQTLNISAGIKSDEQSIVKGLAEQARQFANLLAWQQGAVDFKRFAHLIDMAIVMLSEPGQDWQQDLLLYIDNSQELDVFQCILVAFVLLKLHRVDEANELLLQADSRLMQLPMAPERLLAGFMHRRLFDVANSDSTKAAACYLIWAQEYQQRKYWYRAIKMAYLSFQRQATATSALLLAELMQHLKLSSYRELDLGQLWQYLATLPLSASEQLQFSRLQQLAPVGPKLIELTANEPYV